MTKKILLYGINFSPELTGIVKLTGMLASARPVVATAHPDTELANVVQACGLVAR